MDFKALIDSYVSTVKKAVDFSGRARRREYWVFALGNFVVTFVLGLLEGMILGTPYITLLACLVLTLASIAVGVRRLHDIGKSGWWFLIVLVPFVGGFIFLYFTVLDSQPGSNEYGPNPKGM